MSSIEITDNEYRAAQEMGERYFLVLVTGVETENPKIQIIGNIHAKIQGGLFQLSLQALRFSDKLHRLSGAFFKFIHITNQHH